MLWLKACLCNSATAEFLAKKQLQIHNGILSNTYKVLQQQNMQNTHPCKPYSTQGKCITTLLLSNRTCKPHTHASHSWLTCKGELITCNSQVFQAAQLMRLPTSTHWSPMRWQKHLQEIEVESFYKFEKASENMPGIHNLSSSSSSCPQVAQ